LRYWQFNITNLIGCSPSGLSCYTDAPFGGACGKEEEPNGSGAQGSGNQKAAGCRQEGSNNT